MNLELAMFQALELLHENKEVTAEDVASEFARQVGLHKARQDFINSIAKTKELGNFGATVSANDPTEVVQKWRDKLAKAEEKDLQVYKSAINMFLLAANGVAAAGTGGITAASILPFAQRLVQDIKPLL